MTAQDLVYSLVEEISVINKGYCGYYAIESTLRAGN